MKNIVNRFEKGAAKRIAALALAACMTFTMSSPVTAAAQGEGGAPVLLSGFAELADEVREQSVPTGALLEELNLPGSLEATVYTALGEPAPMEEDNPPAEGNVPVTLEGVTWVSDIEFDGETEGTYIFTALLPSGYELAEGVSPPEIAVTVLRAMPLDSPEPMSGGNVASVNGKEYATLGDAIAAAKSASEADEPSEAYTVTLLSDAPASPFGEAITGKVILDLAGFHITITPMFGNPPVITVLSSGDLTLRGGGEISTDINNVIVNQGILTVMDTVKLTSSKFYGLSNQKNLNLYGGFFAGYTAMAGATVNLKNGPNTYKTLFALNDEEFTLPDGKCSVGYDFKVVPAAPPEPGTPVAKIGGTTYATLSKAFGTLSQSPGTEEEPIVIEVLADCGAALALDVPETANVILKSEEDKGPYTLSRLENGMDGLVSVHGSLTVENLTLDGGATSGLTAKSALVTVTQWPEGLLPHLTLGQGAVLRNNHNQSSLGGGVYLYGGTLTLDGGKIYGNSVTGVSRGGGGVYLETLYGMNTTLNLLGGEISGNTAAFAGGVAVGSGATVTASGSPVVRGNLQNGVESNFYFSDTPLKLTGPLSDGAYLGVTLGSDDSLGVLVPVAEGEGYPITDADYARFHKDAAGARHELRFQDGKVSLYDPVCVAYSINHSGAGDIPKDNKKYAQGDTVAVIFDPPLVRPGYFFKGWAKRSDAADPDYARGGATEITVPGYAHISLFAVWERNPHVLTGAASNIEATSATLIGSVTVYGSLASASGFYLTKPTGREELPLGGSTALTAALTELTPGAEYEYQAFADYNGARYLGESRRFRTKPKAPPTGSIDGGVTNNTGRDCDVTVTIEEGNIIRATQTLKNVGNGTRSGFKFENLPDGFYNVVADNGEYKVTRLVEVKGGAAAVDVELTLGKTQSVVEIVTPDTPPAAADGLPDQFEDENIVDDDKGDTGYTQSDKGVVTSGGTVELKLAVERKDEGAVSDDAALITKAAAGQTIPIYLDLSVVKTIISADEDVPTTHTKLVSVPKLLTVVLPLPGEASGKRDITAYRVHNGEAEALPKADPGENGEWAETDGVNITLHVRQFSTYAVGYKAPSGGGGGGGGGGSILVPAPEEPEAPTPPVEPEVSQPETSQPGERPDNKPNTGESDKENDNDNDGDSSSGIGDDNGDNDKNDKNDEKEQPSDSGGNDARKDEIRGALEDEIKNLPGTLTDEQRQEYIDRLTEIAGTAITALDGTNDPDEWGRIAAQAIADMEKLVAEALALAGGTAKPFVVLSAVFALAAVLLAVFALLKRKDKRRKLFTAIFAAFAVAAFLLTTGWSGFALASWWTLAVAAFALGAALGVFARHSKREKVEFLQQLKK